MGKPKIIYKKKLRSFINFMATEIFIASIKKYQNKYLNFEFNFDDEEIKLKINMQRIDAEGGLNGFDIDGSSSDEDIFMKISIYNLSFNKTSYNEFQASVREFLRHEMEHISQYYELYGKANIYGLPPSESILDYFMQPYEIDAFLHGLNYRRKYLKTNILDEINNLLTIYYNIEDKAVIETIKTAWVIRLKEILPHTL